MHARARHRADVQVRLPLELRDDIDGRPPHEVNPPVFSSAMRVDTSGRLRTTRCRNGGLPRQCWSNASRRMYWSRFHSTNRQGPVPMGAAANAWSPTFSTYLPGTIASPASRPMSAGKGFSVITRTVSASTICTVLMPCSWPPDVSFFAESSARSKEYFTSSGVSASPLWNLTSWRSLNSSTVSETDFHDVASAGSRSPLTERWTSLSKMLPLTKEAFSSSTWGSKENGRFLTPSVTVSLGWAADKPEVTRTSATARTKILMNVPSCATP